MAPKIKIDTEITGCQPCVAVCFKNPVIPIKTKLLDQSGFPWRVAHMDQKVGYLTPLREEGPVPTRVTSLRLYEEGLEAALVDRVCTYVALIEALDLRTRTVYVTPDIHIPDPFHNTRPRGPNLRVLNDPKDTPPHSVLIQDERDVLWGPLPMIPERAPLEWPFSGKIIGSGNKTIELQPESKDTFLVTDGTISISIDVYLAFELASALLEKGWPEVVRKYSPSKRAMLFPESCSNTPPA